MPCDPVITEIELELLELVKQSPGGTKNALASGTMPRSTVYRAIPRMVEKGFLVKKPSDDGLLRYRLSSYGRSLLRVISKHREG